MVSFLFITCPQIKIINMKIYLPILLLLFIVSCSTKPKVNFSGDLEIGVEQSGVLEQKVAKSYQIQLDSNSLITTPGNSEEFNFVVSSLSQKDLLDVSLILSSTHNFLNLELVETPKTFQLDSDAPRPISITINTSEDAIPGTYKVLLGAQLPDVAISKYVTVTIE